MFISKSLSTGEVTFIIRAAIQFFSYTGYALLVAVLLQNAPRIANARTHSVINRIVGASTEYWKTFVWLRRCAQRTHTGRSPSMILTTIISLYITYALSVRLSDIGFLGFQACPVRPDTFLHRPSSVKSHQDATKLIQNSLQYGASPETVNVHRCDSTQLTDFGFGVILFTCAAWRNSTYADHAVFSGLNTTDTDVLMPRFLSNSSAQVFDVSSYRIGPGTQRVLNTTLQKGIFVDPHEMGMTAVFGVPALTPNTEVGLDQALSVELEVGCMTLGIQSTVKTSSALDSDEVFQTSGSWRTYTGPDFMVDTLTNYTDQLRHILQPLFNVSTDSSGNLHTRSLNDSFIFSPLGRVISWQFPTIPGVDIAEILAECSLALQTTLELTSFYPPAYLGHMCSLSGVGGSMYNNGISYSGYSRMICATATQINMVSANITMHLNSSITSQVTRLPSDLHHLLSFYGEIYSNGTQLVGNYTEPLERFTLSPNPSGPTSHYIVTKGVNWLAPVHGPGSPGGVLTVLGDVAPDPYGAFRVFPEYEALPILSQGFRAFNFTPDVAVKWIGEVGAGFILNSVGYNGWAALDSAPLRVVSTVDATGTCYKPVYAIGFLPFVISTIVAIAWSSLTLLSSTVRKPVSELQKAYGGVNPYLDAAGISEDATLIWCSKPKPYLRSAVEGEEQSHMNQAASRFLKLEEEQEQLGHGGVHSNLFKEVSSAGMLESAVLRRFR